MNTHDATEIAYKRGYQQAVRDIFEDIEVAIEGFHIANHCAIVSLVEIAELKKKYLEVNNEQRKAD